MRSQLKQLVDKSEIALTAHHIYTNWRDARRIQRGKFEYSAETVAGGMSVSESLNYAHRVFEDYLRYAGLSKDLLRGRRVLELGPGDNLAVALLFLSGGAQEVAALDRFPTMRTTSREREIYLALRGQLDEPARRLFDESIRLDSGIEMNPDKLRYVSGRGIEDAVSVLDQGFDMIVSRAVLQEIHDVEGAFASMDRLLAPGGVLLHKIDLRDYGMYSRHGMHPLTFLTVSDSPYHWMTAASGRPNRRLLDFYRQEMAKLGYETKLLVTHIAGRHDEIVPHKEELVRGVDYSDATVDLIEAIRPRLRTRVRGLAE